MEQVVRSDPRFCMRAVALQPDGRIVLRGPSLGGSPDLRIARLTDRRRPDPDLRERRRSPPLELGRRAWRSQGARRSATRSAPLTVPTAGSASRSPSASANAVTRLGVVGTDGGRTSRPALTDGAGWRWGRGCRSPRAARGLRRGRPRRARRHPRSGSHRRTPTTSSGSTTRAWCAASERMRRTRPVLRAPRACFGYVRKRSARTRAAAGHARRRTPRCSPSESGHRQVQPMERRRRSAPSPPATTAGTGRRSRSAAGLSLRCASGSRDSLRPRPRGRPRRWPRDPPTRRGSGFRARVHPRSESRVTCASTDVAGNLGPRQDDRLPRC